MAGTTAMIEIIAESFSTIDFESQNGCQPCATTTRNGFTVLAMLFATTVGLAVLL